MAIPEWLRRLPHPGYGSYGGAQRDNIPDDAMDVCFRDHDDMLQLSETRPPSERDILRDRADHELALCLRKDLKPYKRKIYGPLYNFFAKLVFRPNKKE